MVTACAAGTQIDSACLKTKAAGGEVEAELTTYHALRNSACGYLFLGATTREVAPDAVMAVHNSKLTLTIRWRASAHQIEEIRARDIAKADHERAAFIMAMGISHELNDLIATVKFESLHVLTRAELYRFGVDTRPFSETAWTLESAARPYVHKTASAKKGDGAFRAMEWRLFCEAKDRARLMFAREFDQGAVGKSSVMMMAGPEKSLAFGHSRARRTLRSLERQGCAGEHDCGRRSSADGREYPGAGRHEKSVDIRDRYQRSSAGMGEACRLMPR